MQHSTNQRRFLRLSPLLAQIWTELAARAPVERSNDALGIRNCGLMQCGAQKVTVMCVVLAQAGYR
jgi:hypothetical protein